MAEQLFNVSHGIKVGINTIHDDVVFDPIPDTDSRYTTSAIDVSANKKAIRLAGSGATTGNQDITFAGGSNITLSRTGNEITIGSTFTDSNANTTYSVSAVDGTTNKKIIRLTAGGSGSGDDDITLAGGTNVTLTRSGDEISFISTDTTYNITAEDTGSADQKRIRLTDSTSGISSVTLIGGNNISISRSGNNISIASTYTDSNTDTTYSVSAADGGTAAKKVIRLTAGGAGSGTDDVTLVAGTNISLTRSSDEITITGANEADTLTSVTDRGASTTNDVTVASLTATGNINCAGTITYDDVTSVDSVGIITARQGLDVTGNVTVTGTVDGRDVASDGTKLDGIASGAEVNVNSDWNSTTGDSEILNKPTNVSAFTNDAGYVTSAGAIPTGCIILWSGAQNAIPSGWTLCNGSNSTPDLRDRFVVGAGSNYSVNDTGGNQNITLATGNLPSHTHSDGNYSADSAGGHSHGNGNYSTSNTGAHSHTLSGNTSNTGNHSHSGNTNNTGAHTHTWPYASDDSQQNTRFEGRTMQMSGNSTVTTSSAGAHSHSFNTSNTGAHSHTLSGNTSNTGNHSHNLSGNSSNTGSHTHGVSGNSGSTGSGTSFDNRPPYYALCYIMKT